MPGAESIRRDRIEVKGVVQGVGFRPFVHSLAKRLGLSGFVKNCSSGVSIEVEGRTEVLAQFAECLRKEAPSLARIDAVEKTTLAPTGGLIFEIAASENCTAASTFISPDVATCDLCLAEFRDPMNRRFRFPFTSCTHCGPRYTIIRDMPFDRSQTTMSVFRMCQECDREYHDPSNRRYHAQPNACAACGPKVWLTRVGTTQSFEAPAEADAVDESAIEAFHRSIAAGEIVATKGLGGFHLACSATNSAAIQALRLRKRRADKPLAVMVADIAVARLFAEINDAEERLLSGRERPIVLLRKLADTGLSEFIAPGNEFVGIMLAYSPLHALLVERQPLVMTSGNLGDEPIARTNEEAVQRLNSLADAYLFHNRDIHVTCDDSVVRVTRGHELPIRRSRGYAPLPVRREGGGPDLLAVGGELKSTFCLASSNYAYLGPHVGDMGNLETMEAFCRSVEHFQRIFRIDPKVIARDLHPDYLSSRWAEAYGQRLSTPLVEVQHHHAHIASVLAEHQCDRDRQVIGVSFDGTGYGTDGAIWGGEILVASCRAFHRRAHLKYIPMPGGDVSMRHPYRSALSHLWSAAIEWDDRLPCVANCSRAERKILRRQLEGNVNCVPTSSMGRLFDAVAALIGIRQSVSYEAQAVIEMESLAGEPMDAGIYPYSICHESPWQIDVSPLLAAIVEDTIAYRPRSEIIARFHQTIAHLIVDLCVRLRAEVNLPDVALSGGVFQNLVLLKLAEDQLRDSGFTVLTNRVVPPNDGGLALGQAIVASSQFS